MSHPKLKNTILRDAVVTYIFEDEYENLIGIGFEKDDKKYILKIKGFDCKISLTEG